jgi:hypothetical protein
MHLTEWSYRDLMETPRVILWQLMLVADVHAEKRENEEWMRNALATGNA